MKDLPKDIEQEIERVEYDILEYPEFEKSEEKDVDLEKGDCEPGYDVPELTTEELEESFMLMLRERCRWRLRSRDRDTILDEEVVQAKTVDELAYGPAIDFERLAKEIYEDFAKERMYDKKVLKMMRKLDLTEEYVQEVLEEIHEELITEKAKKVTLEDDINSLFKSVDKKDKTSDNEDMEKAKYIKREGSKGNYKYTYADGGEGHPFGHKDGPMHREAKDGQVMMNFAAVEQKAKGMTDAQLQYAIKDAKEALAANPDGKKAGFYQDEVHVYAKELKDRKAGKKDLFTFIDEKGAPKQDFVESSRKIQEGVKAPFVRAAKAPMGGGMVVAIAPVKKEEFDNGIFENHGVKFMIDADGTMEQITGNRNMGKFRKQKAKSLEQAIEKLNKYVSAKKSLEEDIDSLSKGKKKDKNKKKSKPCKDAADGCELDPKELANPGQTLVHRSKIDETFDLVKGQKLVGGLGDKKKDADFDPKELEMGIKVELEHTKDKKVAKEIAHDHLTEDPKYYTKLKKIEKK